MSEQNKEQVVTVVEGYELPSKGKIYEKPIDPKIELRPMRTMEEMKRLSPSQTPYKSLSDIIEACLITKPNMSVYDMCLGDYEYLLHKLRIVTYGPEYKLTVGCARCGHVQEETVNLDSLKVKEYNDKEIRALMTLTLPKSKKIITLKYQTPRVLDEIELRKAEYKKENKGTTIDPTLLLTIECGIDTVDGEKLKYIELEDFVNNLEMKDSKAIIKNLNQINTKVGLDTSLEFTCGQCGYDISTFFRFTNEFFGPTND